LSEVPALSATQEKEISGIFCHRILMFRALDL
jgi:hypothetical protein